MKTRNMITLLSLLVLSSIMQATAVDYKNHYKSEYRARPAALTDYKIGATAPAVSFHSTSVYSVQWNETSVTPMLNADGTVNTEAYGVGHTHVGPRRSGSGSGSNPGTPDDDEEDEGEQQPLGDAVLPLLLLALAYICVRRMRAINKGEKAMKKSFFLITLLVLVSCTPQDANEITFDPSVLYSREMINARMTNWYNKDTEVGFPNANSTNGSTSPETAASWDYVPGVVAKGILDVWEYYQDSAWADAWYEGLCAWGLQHEATDKGGILDDLNCTKVYLGLYKGARPSGKFENAENAAYFMEQLHRGARGLEEHKLRYTIQEGPAAGGWMHKANEDKHALYWGQMWCDGAYMGPALLAELLAMGATEGLELGWNDVYDQFDASWYHLWNEEKQLLYHVLFSDIDVNTNARTLYESGHLYPCENEGVWRSEESWGRAVGWYMMALVDVLEAYLDNLINSGEWKEGAPLPSTQHFDEMRGYLEQLAESVVARQDKETGCWYQLLGYGPEKSATQGIDETGSERYTNVEAGGTQYNYLESSASCLITAALLKGSRLGIIHQEEAGKRGFEGIVKTFLRSEQGEWTIMSSCQSAGLSKDRNGSAAYYLIGKDVGIQNNTEGKVLGAFLMAAVEYERLAK